MSAARRQVFGWASLVAGLTLAAQAQAASYSSENTDWDGLSAFSAIASSAGVELVERDEWDLASDPIDVLLWIYPTGDVDAEGVLEWVRQGGALWLADDFGAGAAIADALAMARSEAGGRAPSGWTVPSGVVEARAAGSHPLSDGAPRILLNHATSFGDAPGATYRAGGAGVVYDLSLGNGDIVLLSDPSVLTNLMLPLASNTAFATNALERLCPGAPCTVAVATEDARVTGVAPEMELGPPASLSRLVDRVRNARPHPSAARLVAALILGGLALLVAAVFPRRPPAWLAARIDPHVAPPRGAFEHALGRHAAASTNHAQLTARLAEAFFGALGASLGVAAQGDSGVPSVADAQTAADRYLRVHEPKASRRRARMVREGFATLARAPAALERGGMHVSVEEFERWYRLTESVRDRMDKER